MITGICFTSLGLMMTHSSTHAKNTPTTQKGTPTAIHIPKLMVRPTFCAIEIRSEESEGRDVGTPPYYFRSREAPRAPDLDTTTSTWTMGPIIYTSPPDFLDRLWTPSLKGDQPDQPKSLCPTVHVIHFGVAGWTTTISTPVSHRLTPRNLSQTSSHCYFRRHASKERKTDAFGRNRTTVLFALVV